MRLLIHKTFYIIFVLLSIVEVTAQQPPNPEQLLHPIDQYDNFGTLSAHAFNSKTGILACVFSTGEVKSFNIYSRLWISHTIVSFIGDNPQVDVSDDGYILVCCPYKQSKLIDIRRKGGQVLPLEVFHAVFISGRDEILVALNPVYAKENSLEIYTYPDLLYKYKQKISWEDKQLADTAKFFALKRYGNLVVAQACINPRVAFRENDTMHLDTIRRCQAFNKIAFEIPGFTGGEILPVDSSNIHLFSNLPDSLRAEDILMGDISADSSKLLFARNKEIVELNLKNNKIRFFGTLNKTIKKYDSMTDKYSIVKNEYEFYNGLYYTKDGKILSVNNNGEILLWNFN